MKGKTTLFTIIAIILVILASWLLTCGFIWLITLCFGIGFDILKATGVWLVLWLLGMIFSKK